MDITKMNFTVTIYFSNGAVVQREVELPKAAKLAMKSNVIVPEDTEFVEVRGMNSSLIIPVNMTFVINCAPEFKHIDKVSRYMLYKRDGGKCCYCGKNLTLKESTVDHIIPKDQGGLNIWENVALSCKPCNCKKDNRKPEEAGMKLMVTPYNPKKRNNA